jgi:hypothetical protein
MSAMLSGRSDADAGCRRPLAKAMAENRDSLFRTGQSVWVIQPDGPPRPAEYLGEGERRGPSSATNALVIYADASGADVVEVWRLRPRDAVERRGRRAAEAGQAAARRAELARQRGQAAARRSAEFRAEGTDPKARVQGAIERAFAAADAAKDAEAGAAEALDRAAKAWERAACTQERLAEAAERCGDARAPAHRLAVTQASQRATGAREAAAAARQRVSSS